MAGARIEEIRVSEPEAYHDYRVSRALRAGGLLFVSGQVAIDERGELVGAGDVRAQGERAFENLACVLELGGSSMERVVRVGIFVRDMRTSLEHVIALRERFFRPPYPADTLVEVSALARPEFLIEVEAIALVP